MSYTRITERDAEFIRITESQWNNALQCEERQIIITSRVEGIRHEITVHCFGVDRDPVGVLIDPQNAPDSPALKA